MAFFAELATPPPRDDDDDDDDGLFFVLPLAMVAVLVQSSCTSSWIDGQFVGFEVGWTVWLSGTRLSSVTSS